MKNIAARVTVTIHASAENVWEALTDPQMIKEYFFGTHTKTDWKVGSPITFTGEYEGKTYEDKGTILQFKPHKLLQYTHWSSMSGIEDKPENYVSVSYLLTEEGGQTVLDVIQENIPDEKTKEHSKENWKKVLTNLKQLLENKTVAAPGF